MKRTITLLVAITCLLMSIPGFAQKVTISQTKAPLSKIFSSIKRQTGYSFIYRDTLLRHTKRIDLKVIDTPLEDVLKLIFEHQPIRYEVRGRTILLFFDQLAANRKPPPPTTSPEKINIRGRIVNQAGEPIASATIIAPGSNQQVTSNEDGYFSLNDVIRSERLIVSTVSYETEMVDINNSKELYITLKPQARELTEVVVSNGFQKQPIERLTGSFSKVNNELLNRRVSTTVLERLDGVTSSVLFNKNIQVGDNKNQSSISIRGRSTIFANPEPLIILDNFPYTGDINNINPNDVESITVLKDAAAASIWGAYAANGVIVVTTKVGKYNQPIKLSFNTNITIGEKPNLFYEQIISPSDYIDVERFLFGNDHYIDRETSPEQPELSPAVEIMIQERDGKLSHAQATSLLDQLRQQDVRRDKEKYFYRKSINQQYSINASGGGPHNQYYFSAGYDKNLNSQVGNQYDRITLNANNTYAWLDRKLELTTGIIFSASQLREGMSIPQFYPYDKLVGSNGEALAVNLSMRQSYIDTAGGGRLLDWHYRPLDELRLVNNKTQLTDYRINIGLKYKILKDFLATVNYQYNKGFSQMQNLHSQDTYFARDLINRYTQINNGFLSTPIPYGAILDKAEQDYQAHNVRAQIDYTHSWNANHSINVFAGAEVRSFTNQEVTARQYGYDPDRQTNMPIDYQTEFSLYPALSTKGQIPYLDKNRLRTNRYISYFINAAYTILRRYTISASARKDESNIFGVKTNQKGVPLWSTGVSWEISKEKFYHQANWLPYLRLRVTHGYNGNVDRSVSAFTTATIDGVNGYGALTGNIINPPNPALRWEKVQMTNLGIDFASLNNVISGSLEYYRRKAEDLIGNSPLDPTTGNPTFRGNTANMNGNGIDVTIHSQNIRKKNIRWTSAFLISYTKDEVTEYMAQQTSINYYYNADFFNPLKGWPLYSIYSLQWAGLDPLTGNPRGYIGKETTQNYNAILNSTDFSSMQYEGPANPTLFGSIRNAVEWKQLQLSFNITWKAGYYFRRPSIYYDDLFNLERKVHSDFSKRWQNPGDELHTNVPSLVYPNNRLRDIFYQYSSVLVEKGDHVRLQDIRLSYDLNKQKLKKSPIQALQFYIYANNLGILWRANKQHIDPDYISGFPASRTIAGGVKIDFK